MLSCTGYTCLQMLRDVWFLSVVVIDVNRSWCPPHASYRLKRYQNQPMKIENYEPGMSSVVLLDPFVVSCSVSLLLFALPIKGLHLKTSTLLIMLPKPFGKRFTDA